MARVLLAAHGGSSAAGAVRVAPLVAERLGADLDIVGVLQPLVPVDYGFGVTFGGSPELDEQLEAQLGRELDAQLARCGVSGHPVILHGPPAMEIAAAARTSRAELIVLGLGPHHLQDRAFGGETALQLVQVASTPVLAVPGNATMLPRNVVVAMDFTPSSIGAAHSASRLLRDGDMLHLVHVRSAPEIHSEAAAAKAHAARPVTSAEQSLAALAASMKVAPGVQLQHVVIDGPPARTLLDYLERVHGDLIALGSHGYGFWKRLTIGSVASKVLRLVNTMILVQPIGSVAADAAHWAV